MTDWKVFKVYPGVWQLSGTKRTLRGLDAVYSAGSDMYEAAERIRRELTLRGEAMPGTPVEIKNVEFVCDLQGMFDCAHLEPVQEQLALTGRAIEVEG